MANEKSWFSLETLVVVAAVLVGIVVLIKLAVARSSAVVQQPQGNPWVAAIDAAPGIITATGNILGTIFKKHDTEPSGISVSDDEYISYIDSLPMNRPFA